MIRERQRMVQPCFCPHFEDVKEVKNSGSVVTRRTCKFDMPDMKAYDYDKQLQSGTLKRTSTKILGTPEGDVDNLLKSIEAEAIEAENNNQSKEDK